MFEQLDKCTNLRCRGVHDLQDAQEDKIWRNIPVYEMTREPKCDKRKDRKEGD